MRSTAEAPFPPSPESDAARVEGSALLAGRARHLAAGPASLAEPDRDRLLAAGDAPARAARAQLPALHLAHRPLDLLRRLAPVTAPARLAARLLSRHRYSPPTVSESAHVSSGRPAFSSTEDTFDRSLSVWP